MRRIFTFLLALFAIALMGQSTGVSFVAGGAGGTATFTLCSAETAVSGVCENAGAIDISAKVVGFTTMKASWGASTGTGSCEIYEADKAVADAAGADLSGIGQIVSAFPISATAPNVSFKNAAFYLVWAKCTGNTGSITITLQAVR